MTFSAEPGHVDVVVVGAHLSGEPLNWQLTERGATVVGPVRTAPCYRLYALPTEPPKPGLVRVTEGGGSIEAERWRLGCAAFGAFVSGVPSPLAIGVVLLDDGDAVQGFLCESWAVTAAQDITCFGGWRAFRRAG